MRRTLVIGAAGFIGSHLVRRLLAEGDEVHALLRETTRMDRLQEHAGDLRIHRTDLTDRVALDSCLAESRPDRVFHLAAETRSVMAADCASSQRSLVNLVGLVNLVDALTAMDRPPEVVVRAGTIAEYGNAPLPFREDVRETPVNPYGASMLAGTHYLGVLKPVLPCPIPTARLALVYGSGQPESYFVAAKIRKALAGERMVIARPRDRRDLIHVSDVVAGLLALADNPPPGASVVNIATGIAPTMREVAELIVAATGTDPGLIEYRPQPDNAPVSELISDTARARALLGWEAAVPFEQGIRQVIAEIRAQGAETMRKAG